MATAAYCLSNRVAEVVIGGIVTNQTSRVGTGALIALGRALPRRLLSQSHELSAEFVGPISTEERPPAA